MPNKFQKFFQHYLGCCFGRFSPSPDLDEPQQLIELTSKRKHKIQRQAKHKQNAKISDGGVAFEIDNRPATPGASIPSRLEGHTNTDKLMYNHEAKQNAAEMHRINLMNDTIKKARALSALPRK